MKAITLSKDSWHFKIAKFGGYKHWMGSDFCKYVRSFFAGIFWGIVLTIIASGVASFVGTLLYQTAVFFYRWAFAGVFEINPFVGVSWGLILSISVLAGILYGYATWCERQRENQNQKDYQPGFVKLVYLKLKDKTCFKVKFD